MSPPSSFQCSSLSTPVPVAQPTLPPLSSPVPNSATITIQLQLDFFTRETGWSLETIDGIVLRKVEPNTYVEEFSTITESISVASGRWYDIVLTDTSGDGFCCRRGAGYVTIFLGDAIDYSKVLVALEPDFEYSGVQSFFVDPSATITAMPPSEPTTMSPSVAPTIFTPPTSATVQVTVFIKFDTYPIYTSWSIEDTEGNRVAAGGPYSPFVGPDTTQVVDLIPNEAYVFTIKDVNFDFRRRPIPGNGLCCDEGEGAALVYFGGQVQLNQVLVYDDGRFTNSRSHTFVASPSSTFEISSPPSSVPTATYSPSASSSPTATTQVVLVQIQMDSFPREISWEILNARDGSYVYGVPSYDSNVSQSLVNETVTLIRDQTYFFLLYDSFGDGIFGGFAAVYLGEEASINNTLVFVEGRFGGEANHTFTASANAIAVVSPAPSMTRSRFPSPSPVDSTLAPTMGPSVPTTDFPTSASQVEVLIELLLDDSPSQTGWSILSSPSDQVVFDIRPGNYSFRQAGTKVNYTLSLDPEREYIFQATDTLGNGLVSFSNNGYIYIYLGTTPSLESAILYESGEFFFLHRQTF